MNGTSRIRIGTQSAFSAVPFLAPFDYAVAHGFEAFEWLPDLKESGVGWVEKDVDLQTRRHIKQTSIRHDIQISVHAPWDLSLANPGHRERLKETIQFARDVGGKLLNVHLYTEDGLDAYIQGLVSLISILAENGFTLSVENTALTGPVEFNRFFGRLRRFAPEAIPYVGMCLDIGHANLCGATQNDYLGFIDALAPEVRIVHVHMHENYGDHDSHLTLFTGPSRRDESGIEGFVARMKRRAFSGSIILEQWPDPPTLLDQARDRLKAMFLDPSAESARPSVPDKTGSAGVRT